jgi:D-lyxose ketol-isomerase
LIEPKIDIKWVGKGWGGEKWIVNNDLYCGKWLLVLKDKMCSVHFHEIKDETFYCHSGSVVIEIIHNNDPNWLALYQPGKDPSKYLKSWNKWYAESKSHIIHELRLVKGSTLHVPPLTVHRFRGLTDAELFEFSTHHDDKDSIRIMKGD